MGEDLSTGAKIGITLIILCSLIAIVFSLLTMMKNITNSGASQLQGSLDQMLLTQFDDYNQKTVSGTQVVSSLKVFEGQDVAIVIQPALAAKKKDLAGGFNYGAILAGYDNKDTSVKGYGKYYTCASDVSLSKCSEYKSDTTTFAGLYLHSSQTYYVGKFADTDAELLSRNDNTRPTAASGKPSYVRSSAKYRAMLIKDESDAIIGICFTELVASAGQETSK